MPAPSGPTPPLTLDRNRGALDLGGDRVLLLRPETFSELQKGVEDRLGAKAAEFVYAAGAAWAAGAWKRWRAQHPGHDELGLQELFERIGQLGWGRWTLEPPAADARRVVVRIEASPFAEGYGQSDNPVCHFAAGVLAGLWEGQKAAPARCTESACRAQGATECTLVAEIAEIAEKEAWAW